MREGGGTENLSALKETRAASPHLAPAARPLPPHRARELGRNLLRLVADRKLVQLHLQLVVCLGEWHEKSFE